MTGELAVGRDREDGLCVSTPVGGRVCGSLAIRRREMPQRQRLKERILEEPGVVTQHRA